MKLISHPVGHCWAVIKGFTWVAPLTAVVVPSMVSMGSECREACSNISLRRKVKSCAFCSECSIYSIKIYCCVHQLLTVFAIAVIKQVLPCERKSFKTNSDMGREESGNFSSVGLLSASMWTPQPLGVFLSLLLEEGWVVMGWPDPGPGTSPHWGWAEHQQCWMLGNHGGVKPARQFPQPGNSLAETSFTKFHLEPRG